MNNTNENPPSIENGFSLHIRIILFLKFELNYLILSFAVFIEDIKIRFISRQSSSKETLILSSIYSDICNSLIQYSVSAVSFKAMCIFEIKSAGLCPYVLV